MTDAPTVRHPYSFHHVDGVFRPSHLKVVKHSRETSCELESRWILPIPNSQVATAPQDLVRKRQALLFASRLEDSDSSCSHAPH